LDVLGLACTTASHLPKEWMLPTLSVSQLVGMMPVMFSELGGGVKGIN